MKFLMIGLGRMGGNIVLNAISKGHEVVVYNRTIEKVNEFVNYGAIPAHSLKEGVNKLPEQKIVFLMLPAGEPTKSHLLELKEMLNKNDIIIDGSNNFYKDTKNHHKILSEKEILFLDIGVSGGITGARNGASMMIGGDFNAFKICEDLISDLCVKDGYAYLGITGSGHYSKMVHNAIEYGMMESIAEGMELIDASEYNYDYEKLLKTWKNGSVIRSWLIDLLYEAEVENKIDSYSSEIGQSGEGLWSVREGFDKGVALPAITSAINRRFLSKSKRTIGNKTVQAQRAMFGGHDDKDHIPKNQ